MSDVAFVHNPVVTSNLAIHSQLAHHGQGGGSTGTREQAGRKSFVPRILYLSPLDLRICGGFLANPMIPLGDVG